MVASVHSIVVIIVLMNTLLISNISAYAQTNPDQSIDAMAVWHNDGIYYSILGHNEFSESAEINWNWYITDKIPRTSSMDSRPDIAFDLENNSVVVWIRYDPNSGSNSILSTSYNGTTKIFTDLGTLPFPNGISVVNFDKHRIRDVSVAVDTEGNALVIWPFTGIDLPYDGINQWNAKFPSAASFFQTDYVFFSIWKKETQVWETYVVDTIPLRAENPLSWFIYGVDISLTPSRNSNDLTKQDAILAWNVSGGAPPKTQIKYALWGGSSIAQNGIVTEKLGYFQISEAYISSNRKDIVRLVWSSGENNADVIFSSDWNVTKNSISSPVQITSTGSQGSNPKVAFSFREEPAIVDVHGDKLNLDYTINKLVKAYNTVDGLGIVKDIKLELMARELKTFNFQLQGDYNFDLAFLGDNTINHDKLLIVYTHSPDLTNNLTFAQVKAVFYDVKSGLFTNDVVLGEGHFVSVGASSGSPSAPLRRMPIVIVPGTLGTILWDDNNSDGKYSNNEKIVWPNFRKLFSEYNDEHLLDLQLNDDGKTTQNPSLNIKPLQSIHFIDKGPYDFASPTNLIGHIIDKVIRFGGGILSGLGVKLSEGVSDIGPYRITLEYSSNYDPLFYYLEHRNVSVTKNNSPTFSSATEYQNYPDELKEKFSIPQIKESSINAQFAYIPNIDLFDWPYDYTRDLVPQAEKLTEFIKNNFDQNGRGKVIIIAHSLGGLPPRYAIVTDPGVSERTDKYITLGTPHAGTTEAYLAIYRPMLFPEFINPQALDKISDNMMGLYSQMPNSYWFKKYSELSVPQSKWNSYNYYLTQRDWYDSNDPFPQNSLKPDFLGIVVRYHHQDPTGSETFPTRRDPAVFRILNDPEDVYSDNEGFPSSGRNFKVPNQSNLIKFRNFWNAMDSWDKVGGLPNKVKGFLLVGYGAQTEKWVDKSNVFESDDWREYLGWMNGDKTVNLISAEALDGSNIKKFYIPHKLNNVEYYKDHSSMPNSKIFLDTIGLILADNPDNVYTSHPFVRGGLTDEERISLGLEKSVLSTSYSPNSAHIIVTNTGTGITNFVFDYDGNIDDTKQILLEESGSFDIQLISAGSSSYIGFEISILDPNSGTINKIIYPKIGIGPNDKLRTLFDGETQTVHSLILDNDGDGNAEKVWNPVVLPEGITLVTHEVTDTFPVDEMIDTEDKEPPETTEKLEEQTPSQLSIIIPILIAVAIIATIAIILLNRKARVSGK